MSQATRVNPNQRFNIHTNASRSTFEEQLALLQENSQKTSERHRQKWARPVPNINPDFDPIIFQQFEVDECIDQSSSMRSPMIRMFGITEPYFYIPAPVGFKNDDIAEFQTSLEYLLQRDMRSQGRQFVSKIEINLKETIQGYHGNRKCPFLKMYFSDTKAMSLAQAGTFKFKDRPLSQVTFESNILYVLRFMIDCKVTGANWIEIPPKKYRIIPLEERDSHCQIELVTCHAPDGEWSKIAPLRILSFDIECAGRKGIFPEAKIDPVIQIANMVTIQGEDKPFIRNVFTLNSCAPIVATDVIECYDQAEMLQAWSNFVVDPDILIGYNIINFDLPYLLDRAHHIGAKGFPYFETRFSSKAYGIRDREQKEEVHHSIITDLQNGNDETRRRLAIYCLKDAYLPQRLMDKLMCLINYMEMARVTGVPFNYLLSRGQQIKVISQLFRKAFEQDLVIPAVKTEGNQVFIAAFSNYNVNLNSKPYSLGTDEQFEGATVIEPEKGFYNVPITTLDFSSLYPSIMIAHNLCYTTLLDNKEIENLNLKAEVDYITTPYNSARFVKPNLRKGLLPTILEDLLAARKKAKAELKKEIDPFRKAVLDGRQLALKISANSVYGFTGATAGKLPCIEISASVTAYGRQMIERTKQEVESRFCIANGYKHNAHVIYGDTDSVMIKFAAGYVTEKFLNPIKLEFEKVYFPYLLINKKRYAGLYWTNPNNWDKLDTKGIETVRRDNCLLVQNVVETCLRKILIDRDVSGAEEYAKKIISDLLQNKIDMSQLQPHSCLAERMRKRDPGSAPTLGDRVAYVIIKATKNAPAYEKSEDPIYVLENNIPIDTNYYLENQLSKPLMRIFEPILGNKSNSLLSGDHTRVTKNTTPTVGGLMKFAVKTPTCLGCKTPLKGNDIPVCKHCKPKLGELFQKQLDVVNSLEIHFARLWTQCQRCQGSLHQDVLCSSRDCPIWYMRKKAQKDVADATGILERFNHAW
ncbi:650_t:CDS:10 [Diversispora eburnea]|uniref:DNA polymerase n=1 Tax=Diversispora eburnea TaxID=1213867 RepID=A0A9N8ZIJ0_9GLOM|nr:650_t:CDS:10 [Diversispora eburnea]